MTDPATNDEPPQPGGDGDGGAPRLIVGLGASAGGITALRDFFANVAAESGHAYVVVLHLSPDHESKLAEVLQAVSPVPVTQVTDAVRMQANHVYVVSPNHSLSANDGMLVPSPVTRAEQRRAPVDLFFRALADTHGARAVSVILSGTGSDGASGFKRVKEHGGLVIAQEPGTAEFSDMPAAAIATGLVDLILRPAEMPAHIRDYSQRLTRTLVQPAISGGMGDVNALRDVLTLVRIRTGHDFSNYKPATVLRRIARRMSIRQVATLDEYAAFVREDHGEAAALMKDLLISVTNFFRDAEAYRALETRVIPQLFSRQRAFDQVRVWCVGCATGEEGYSLAMLLTEAASLEVDPPAVQVFATDLDESAIAVAREGFYTDAEVADVSEERLQRCFQRAVGGYRIRRELREVVLFAHHNVIKDPPFSHLDLVSCRNVLIYLNRSAQARVLDTFHFALRPGRYLFLGLSESPEGTDLFLPLDKNAHIFESRSVATRLPIPVTEPLTVPARGPARVAEFAPGERLMPADLHLRLLEEYAAPSIVVTDEHKIVHLTAGAARYLAVPAGEPSRDVTHVARPELRPELRAALHQAARERASVDVRRVRVQINGAESLVRICVKPVLKEGDPARGFFLILFEEEHGDAAPSPQPIEMHSPTSEAAAQLDEELGRVKGQLRTTIEQYETQVEEAKASNEELQALNEELRSSAEELETSKEELQSVNEELTTVNQELKIKIEELAHTNNDFINFINSSDMASIFLDRNLRVKLATPRAAEVFNLLPGDRGRRLTDITSRLLHERLHEDVRHVLEHLQMIEREVASVEGGWYLMRLSPYRTTDDRIEGVVMTFLDISSRHRAEERLRMGEERLRLLIDSAVDYAIFTMTSEGVVDSWNSGAQRMFGYEANEIVGQPAAVLFTEEDRAAGVPAAELGKAAVEGRAEDERWHVRKNGSRLYCSGVTTRLGDAKRFGFAKIARDLTIHREADLALRNAHAELEDRVRHRTSELQSRVAEHAAAEEHVTALLRKVVTAQEDERARIARDLHDQLGQQMIALRLALERHRERCKTKETPDGDLPKALALASQIDREVDFLAWELRPAILDDLGLAAALPRFVDEWSKHYGIAAECHNAGFSPGELNREGEVTFYRVAQEALNNVVKHAHATRVDVLLETRERTVTLVVEDDGIGFDVTDRELAETGIGLIGMRERAGLVGATLEIESSPGHGTSVFLRRKAVE
jgi:two-component system, chemotaxis family, CheB/CheR fusion protein